MKYFFHIFLAFYFVLKPLVPMLDYVVNYDYISKVLFINKAKPQLHCNGKCYLGKELAKSSQEDSSTSSKTKNGTQKIVDFYIPIEVSSIQTLGKEFFTQTFPVYKKTYSYLFLKRLFKPPLF